MALWTLAKARQSRDTFAQTMFPVVGRTVVLMLMFVSTLVRFLDNSPKRSSASRRKGSSGLSPFPLMGGISARILNPDLSLASLNDFAGCVRNRPWAMCPLLRVLRLNGYRTALDRKSHSSEAMSWRCLMALVRVAILIVALSVSAISSYVSVRRGGLIVLVSRSKAANRILNLARWVSD